MEKVSQNRDVPSPLAEEAADWLARLEHASPEEKRAFVRWLKSSRDATDEVLLAKSTDVLLRQLFRESPVDLEELRGGEQNVVTMAASVPPGLAGGRQGGRPGKSMLKQVPRWAWLSCAGMALAAAFAMAMLDPGMLPQWLHPNVYTTAVGEQRSVQLADGSVISINAKSRLRVDYSHQARQIFLESGQAMFMVAKDASRPFRVHAGNSVVQAIGTKFDVRRHSDRVSVAVVEGVVEVMAEAARSADNARLAELAGRARVAAGESVNVVEEGFVTAPIAINVADVSAWQQRRLVFADNTLAEITEEFSRYNPKLFVRVQGEALRARRFSGVFDADTPENLLTYLAADDSLAVEREGDEIIIRARSATK